MGCAAQKYSASNVVSAAEKYTGPSQTGTSRYGPSYLIYVEKLGFSGKNGEIIFRALFG